MTIHAIYRGTRTRDRKRGTICSAMFLKRYDITGNSKRDAIRECFIKGSEEGSHADRPLSMQNLHKKIIKKYH